MATQEIRTEALSACRYGEAVEITGTLWSAPTVVHDITDSSAIDAVHLWLFNQSVSAVVISLILNPNDSGVQADVDASTFTVSVPASGSVKALDGVRFRQHADAANTETLAAYAGSGGGGDITFTGYVNRMIQPEINPL